MDYQFLGEGLKIENFRGGMEFLQISYELLSWFFTGPTLNYQKLVNVEKIYLLLSGSMSPGFSKIRCALDCNPFESSVELWVVGYKKTMKKVSLHLATPQSPINPSCGSQMGFKTF